MNSIQPMPALPERAPQRIEKRADERKRLVYRLVHVAHEGDQGLGRCRDISESGMRLELTMPVTIGTRIVVSFSAVHIFEGVVIWRKGTACGVALEERIDYDTMLRQSAADTRARGLPGLRPSDGLWATLRCDGSTRQLQVNEVTQYGLTVTHDGKMRSNLQVGVRLPGGRERQAVVRWSKGNAADLALLDPFSVTELGSVAALARDTVREWGRHAMA